MFGMRRREFITMLGGAAAAWPVAARAQQADRVRRVGVLMNGSPRDAEQQDLVAVLAQTLQQLGWTEGRNFRIDIRWGEGDPRAIRRHAESLVASAPDSSSRPATRACRRCWTPHEPFRLCSTISPTRSAPVTSIVWRGRKAMRPAFFNSSTA
jgi:hypothetical protein